MRAKDSCYDNNNNNLRPQQQHQQQQSLILLQLLRPVLVHSLLAALIVAARLVQNGATSPSLSLADNPAGSGGLTSSRLLTHLYLAAFHLEQLVWPAVLSYDWQMGAVPLITSLADGRNLETAAFFLLLGRLAIAATTTTERRPAVIFGLLFLVLPFIPASNLFFRVGFVAAERKVRVWRA